MKMKSIFLFDAYFVQVKGKCLGYKFFTARYTLSAFSHDPPPFSED